jgi:hypothetical protein
MRLTLPAREYLAKELNISKNTAIPQFSTCI